MGTPHSGARVVRPLRNSASYAGIGPYRIPAGWGGDDGSRLNSGVRTAPPKRKRRVTVMSALALLWVALMGLLTLLSLVGGWTISP
jgi:hypothetical protein